MHLQLSARTSGCAVVAAAIALAAPSVAQSVTNPATLQTRPGNLTFPTTGAFNDLQLTAQFAGDFNADGIADIVLGSPQDDPIFAGAGSGTVNVFSGQPGGAPLASVTGNPGDILGFSVAAAGDINGDGFDDVIAGSPGLGGVRGEIRIIDFANPGSTTIAAPTSLSIGARFGHSVSGAGDVNGDGIDDFIVGAPNDSGLNGSVVVFAGSRTGAPTVIGTFTGTGGENFGFSVAGAGDVNNDLRDDVIVGAPINGGVSGPGAAFILSFDPTAPTPATALQIVQTLAHPTPTFGARFGQSVASVGDIDDDGNFDVIVGAPSHGGFLAPTGSAVVFEGITGQVLNTSFGVIGSNHGFSVTGIGDFDGDNFEDWAVGEPTSGGNVGGVAVFRGGLMGGSLAGNIPAPAAPSPSRFGTMVAGSVARQGGSSASDASGDTLDNLLVAARDFPTTVGGTTTFGQASLLQLAPSGALPNEGFRGAGCSIPNGNVARIRYRGHLRNQSVLQVGLRGTTPNAPATLLLGLPNSADLGLLPPPGNAPGCFLLVNQTIAVPAINTNADGTVAIDLPVGMACGGPGQLFIFQWAILDPTANGLGVVTSNALDCECR